LHRCDQLPPNPENARPIAPKPPRFDEVDVDVDVVEADVPEPLDPELEEKKEPWPEPPREDRQSWAVSLATVLGAGWRQLSRGVSA
jgi:hypothetical protein